MRRLATLAKRSTQLAKQVAKLGSVKTLLLTMRAHIRREDVNEHSVGVLSAIAAASDGCRKLIVEAHGVPMLCAVMKRHSLEPNLQRDGCAAKTRSITSRFACSCSTLNGVLPPPGATLTLSPASSSSKPCAKCAVRRRAHVHPRSPGSVRSSGAHSDARGIEYQ